MANETWIERQTRTPEARRRYEQERLILWTTEAICEAMEKRGVNHAAIAGKLGTSRANVTQLLSGSRNMTLRSLAALAHACGMRAEIGLEKLTDSVFAPIEEYTIAVVGTDGRFRPAESEPELPIDTTVLAQPRADRSRAAASNDLALAA
ncbi:MAG: helix-turn-helix transcriptional regulator [Gemmatimonadetes bacterium]|nr:helix-turn-helix transcriptional regulator [Gemmatimonadota bacterium]